MPPRTVALIAAVCLTTGWLLASMLAPPVAKLQALPERRAPQHRHAEPSAPFTEQLQLRLRQAPLPPVPRRNPFVFGTARGRRDTTMTASAGAGGGADRTSRVGPTFTLSGVGVSDTAGGPLHTAVLSDGNTVHLVKAGDTMAGIRSSRSTTAL